MHIFTPIFTLVLALVLSYDFLCSHLLISHVLILCHSFSHRCVTKNVLSFSLCSHTPTFMLVLTFAHFLMLAVSLTLVLISLLLTFYSHTLTLVLSHSFSHILILSALRFHTHTCSQSFFHTPHTSHFVLTLTLVHLHLFSLVFSHSPLTLHSHTR